MLRFGFTVEPYTALKVSHVFPSEPTGRAFDRCIGCVIATVSIQPLLIQSFYDLLPVTKVLAGTLTVKALNTVR
jgi:hypothetical protein